MIIQKMNFPEASVLFPEHEKYDYIDSFGGTFTDKENKTGIEELAHDFLKPIPGWVDALMALRNVIAALAGLKRSNSKGKKAPQKVQFEAGKKAGFFKVYSLTEKEIILGENDKHLSFRVSLFLETVGYDPVKKKYTVTTVVTYNNWMGPVYFFFVKPFHRLIVPAMLKKDYAHLK